MPAMTICNDNLLCTIIAGSCICILYLPSGCQSCPLFHDPHATRSFPLCLFPFSFLLFFSLSPSSSLPLSFLFFFLSLFFLPIHTLFSHSPPHLHLSCKFTIASITSRSRSRSRRRSRRTSKIKAAADSDQSKSSSTNSSKASRAVPRLLYLSQSLDHHRASLTTLLSTLLPSTVLSGPCCVFVPSFCWQPSFSPPAATPVNFVESNSCLIRQLLVALASFVFFVFSFLIPYLVYTLFPF